MRLARLQVSQVRNLADQEIPFDPGLNLLMGANGQGKSSVLESVYLLGTTRSFRTSKLAEVVRIGGGPARVAGEGENPGEALAVLISRTEKKYLRHGKAVGAADYIGAMDVVALSNELVQGFRRKPAERRRFLDRMALATWPGYLNDLSDLRRACAQRGLLAASGGRGPDRKAWDARCAALALPVVRRRREMAAALGLHLREASKRIFPEGQGANVRLVTRPVFTPGHDDAYLAELAAIFEAQEASPGRRETPAGPPRDDLAIEIEGRDLLRYGSAGQVRSLLTAAVLAEMTRLRELKGAYPILLLDDVDADLDEGRYAALLSEVGGGSQVFAATSKPALAAGLASRARRYRVSEGVVTGE